MTFFFESELFPLYSTRPFAAYDTARGLYQTMILAPCLWLVVNSVCKRLLLNSCKIIDFID